MALIWCNHYHCLVHQASSVDHFFLSYWRYIAGLLIWYFLLAGEFIPSLIESSNSSASLTTDDLSWVSRTSDAASLNFSLTGSVTGFCPIDLL